MPSLLPTYHYFCQYALLVASVPLLFPVCPPFCQCTIVANMLLIFASVPSCCQFTVTVAKIPSLLPVSRLVLSKRIRQYNDIRSSEDGVGSIAVRRV
jgi:hypothetical protein